MKIKEILKDLEAHKKYLKKNLTPNQADERCLELFDQPLVDGYTTTNRDQLITMVDKGWVFRATGFVDTPPSRHDFVPNFFLLNYLPALKCFQEDVEILKSLTQKSRLDEIIAECLLQYADTLESRLEVLRQNQIAVSLNDLVEIRQKLRKKGNDNQLFVTIRCPEKNHCENEGLCNRQRLWRLLITDCINMFINEFQPIILRDLTNSMFGITGPGLCGIVLSYTSGRGSK